MAMQYERIVKKKPQIFKLQPLEELLCEIRQNITAKKRSNANLLADWQRGERIYSVSGRSVNEIIHSQKFEHEAELRHFFAEYLLNQIQDPRAKAILLEVLCLGLHQGGFTHVLGRLGASFTSDFFDRSGIFYGYMEKKVNFIPLENGIQIKEFTACSQKVDCDGNEIFLEKGNYYETYSSISVTLAAVKKNKGYKLRTTVNNVIVNCAVKELEPYFVKRVSLLGAGIEFLLSSLLALIKRCWRALTAFKAHNEGLLDECWLSRPYAQTEAENTAPALSELTAGLTSAQGAPEALSGSLHLGSFSGLKFKPSSLFSHPKAEGSTKTKADESEDCQPRFGPDSPGLVSAASL